MPWPRSLKINVVDEPLQPDLIRSLLGASLFSTRLVYHPRIDSTNTHAKELAGQGAEEGTLVLAEEQTAGKGRRGRSWQSPAQSNLLCSILLRPALQADRVFVLTMILALAAVEAVRGLSGLCAGIKWPNDLYVGMKKLAGILTEFTLRDNEIEWVVLGLGLNVNRHPEDLQRQATSIQGETGARVSRDLLLVEILKGLEGLYEEVHLGRVEPLYKRWNEACFILGKSVEIESDREKVVGRAVRIEQDGALILETPAGTTQRIVAGDVSLRWSS